jgi:hypothetical protein
LDLALAIAEVVATATGVAATISPISPIAAALTTCFGRAIAATAAKRAARFAARTIIGICLGSIRLTRSTHAIAGVFCTT